MKGKIRIGPIPVRVSVSNNSINNFLYYLRCTLHTVQYSTFLEQLILYGSIPIDFWLKKCIDECTVCNENGLVLDTLTLTIHLLMYIKYMIYIYAKAFLPMDFLLLNTRTAPLYQTQLYRWKQYIYSDACTAYVHV